MAQALLTEVVFYVVSSKLEDHFLKQPYTSKLEDHQWR
jgi:hypothetical protein